MKKALLITVLIVAVSAPLFFLQEREIARSRAAQSRLIEKAQALGIPTDGTRRTKSLSGSSSQRQDHSRRQRATAKDYATELIRLANLAQNPDDFTPDFETELIAFLAELLELEPDALIHLVDELWETNELPEDEKGEILEVVLATLIQNFPTEGLALLSDLKPKFEDRYPDYEKGSFPALVMMALSKLTETDPQAAKDWLTNNPDIAPKDALKTVEFSVLHNEFSQDFSQALPFLEKMDVADLDYFLSSWELDLSSLERKLSLLDFITEELSTQIEENPSAEKPNKYLILQSELLNQMGSALAAEGPGNAESLFANSDLTAQEKEAIAAQITISDLRAPADWIPFFSNQLSGEARRDALHNTVYSWAHSDFRATAQWIGSQPSGEVKELATHAYAESITLYEPASAADWAETLPPSPQREALMVDIHQVWKERNPEEAQAFAERHQLKELEPEPPK